MSRLRHGPVSPLGFLRLFGSPSTPPSPPKRVNPKLLENLITHTTSLPRLELRGGAFVVSVADGDPRPAVVRELPDDRQHGHGLMLVAKTARRWGCNRSVTGGKVVWAVLARRG